MASTINAKNTSSGVVITPDASGQLELQTVDTTRMTIDVNGNVGIGTNSPATRLDVNGGASVTGNIENISPSRQGVFIGRDGANPGNAGIDIVPSATGVGWLDFTTTGTDYRGRVLYDNNSNTMLWYTNGANERMRIDGSGVISFKANNSSNTTHVFTYNENGGEIALYDNAGSYGSLFDLSTGNTRLLHVLSTGDLSLGIGGANTTGSVIFYRAGFNEAMRIGPSGQLGIGGANYGSSGQVLTSQGSGAAPSWVDSRGMTLLGTLTTTSGSAQTLSGLNLTTYKTLVIYLNNVSMSASAQVRLNSIAITQGTGASGNSVWGACFVDLSIGTFAAISSATASSTGTLSNTGVTNNGNCGVTTAATALVFSPNTGTFDAGTITVYGVS